MKSQCSHCGNHGGPSGWCLSCGKSYAGDAKFADDTRHLTPDERIIATMRRHNLIPPKPGPLRRAWRALFA